MGTRRTRAAGALFEDRIGSADMIAPSIAASNSEAGPKSRNCAHEQVAGGADERAAKIVARTGRESHFEGAGLEGADLFGDEAKAIGLTSRSGDAANVSVSHGLSEASRRWTGCYARVVNQTVDNWEHNRCASGMSAPLPAGSTHAFPQSCRIEADDPCLHDGSKSRASAAIPFSFAATLGRQPSHQ